MPGVDLSEFNPYRKADFAILRVCHGHTEDRVWRTYYNQAFADNMPVGFYGVPEDGDAESFARFFWGLVNGIPHTMGDWYDLAIGDGIDNLLSTSFVDRLRAVFDGGVYANGAALDRMPEYKRFERLWFAGSQPHDRWVLWQTGALNQGVDVDVAADLGAGVRPHWSAFQFPNL